MSVLSIVRRLQHFIEHQRLAALERQAFSYAVQYTTEFNRQQQALATWGTRGAAAMHDHFQHDTMTHMDIMSHGGPGTELL